MDTGFPWRAWLRAARPATLPASAAPVLVGTAAAVPLTHVRFLPFLAALLAALLIQIGTNYANDVYDHRRGADTEHRTGPRRLIQDGLASAAEVFAAAVWCFAVAALLGIYLVWVGGLPILLIGLLSIASGLAYTGGPYPLAYHGLGDLFAFAFFGPIAVGGSAYLQTRAINPGVILSSIPIGFLVTAILVVNNVRDIETDRRAGKRTLAVRLGRTRTRLFYAFLIFGSYAAPPLLLLFRYTGFWFWLPFLSLPLTVANVRIVSSQTGAPLNLALRGTGRLELIYAFLLALSFWL